MSSPQTTGNFGFLHRHDPLLAHLPTLAEADYVSKYRRVLDHFDAYDAVDTCATLADRTDMKPVGVDPKIGFAASIIGVIRLRALGEPLKPYPERVDAALRRLLAGHDWTPAQRAWLERIGKQMRLEIVVDKEALDHGQFGNQGGFNRMNRLFDGRLEDVLGELHEEVWRESA